MIKSMQHPGTDAIVVNYRTPSDLERFVNSFEEDLYAEANLTIVNVDPTAEDMAMGERLAYTSDAHHVVFAENVGYGRACNEAAALISKPQPVIAFFNADVTLTPGAINECSEALMAHSGWGILGPRQTDSSGLLTAAGIIGTRSSPKHRGWKAMDQGDLFANIIEDCPTVAGSAMFVDRELWDELTQCPEWQKACPGINGAFAELHYYSETTLCYHAIEHGYQNAFYGPVKIHHEWHRSSPVGGRVEQNMPVEQQRFRELCSAVHNMPHD